MNCGTGYCWLLHAGYRQEWDGIRTYCAMAQYSILPPLVRTSLSCTALHCHAPYGLQVPHPPRQLLLDAGPTKHRNRFIHLGMGQASPDGSALLFMHRTARGKFFPWCAASRQLQQGTGGCQPTWLTMPVVQEQLMRSVPDPGSMRFDAGKLDTEWYKQACEVQLAQGLTDLDNAGGVDSSSVENDSKHMSVPPVNEGAAGSGVWLLQLPVCNYSQEQLPIPVVPVESVIGLTEFMAIVNGVFAEAAGVLRIPWVDRWKVFWGIL
jgi:hypothetical protein